MGKQTDPDITGGRPWMRLYYECKKKRNVGNPKGILVVALRVILYPQAYPFLSKQQDNYIFLEHST